MQTPATPADMGAWYDHHVGLTNHALDRFADRAQPPGRGEHYLRAALRDLVACEGRITNERPAWSRSNTPAALYIQINEFLLLVLEDDERRPGCFTAVTIVNGMREKTWQLALQRGWIELPPRPPRPYVTSDDQLARIHRDLMVTARQQFPAPRRPPFPGGLPLTPRWWRGWCDRAREIRRQNDTTSNAREQWLQQQLEPHRMCQRQEVAGLERWRTVAWPAYEAQVGRLLAARHARGGC